MNEILEKKREKYFQVFGDSIKPGVVGHEAFNKPADIWQFMFYKKEVCMFEVFDDQVDRVGDQRQVGFAKILTRRFELAYYLLKLEAFFQANLLQGLL